MRKLAVFETVGLAYTFVFGNIGTIYRLCWFPALLALAVSLPFEIWPPVQVLASPGALPGAGAFLGGIALVLFQVFCWSMALVMIHRVVLFGGRRTGTVFYFSAGPTEFLFTAMWIAFGAAFFAFGFLTVSLTALVGDMASSISLPKQSGFAVILVFLFAGVWVACRLVPLAPLMVVTERPAIRQSWRLSRGNAGRIFGVLALSALPIVLLNYVVGLILLPIMFAFVSHASQADLPRLLVWLKLAASAMTFVVGIPLLALGAAVLCYCFKALAGYAPGELVD